MDRATLELLCIDFAESATPVYGLDFAEQIRRALAADERVAEHRHMAIPAIGDLTEIASLAVSMISAAFAFIQCYGAKKSGEPPVIEADLKQIERHFENAILDIPRSEREMAVGLKKQILEWLKARART